MRAQHWRGVEGKEERTGEKCCVGWCRGLCVYACACTCVLVCICVGGCVGAGESRGLRLKEEQEILSGKAERRIEREMAGDSRKWEEQYGGR